MFFTQVLKTGHEKLYKTNRFSVVRINGSKQKSKIGFSIPDQPAITAHIQLIYTNEWELELNAVPALDLKQHCIMSCIEPYYCDTDI